MNNVSYRGQCANSLFETQAGHSASVSLSLPVNGTWKGNRNESTSFQLRSSYKYPLDGLEPGSANCLVREHMIEVMTMTTTMKIIRLCLR